VTIHFYKYQGTGNDFILLDNRNLNYQLNQEQIALLCHRHFGIGADGLMLLQTKIGFDFEMVYYNSDGKQSSMCGNGGRCITQFANDLGIVSNKAHFVASDGKHEALILSNAIELKMIDTAWPQKNEQDYVLNTGSPHYLKYVNEVKNLDVFIEGRKIRYSNAFSEKGINVNFIEVIDHDSIFVRTYERGVENETLSCGTGVTAAALVHAYINEHIVTQLTVNTLGGNLNVKFERHNDGFHNVWLCGTAKKSFQGSIEI
jgi:diaminopimelate epimerase